MIISMNATVCGDMTMVSKRRFMIAGSDQGRGAQEGAEKSDDQERREFQVLYEKGCSVAMLAAT